MPEEVHVDIVEKEMMPLELMRCSGTHVVESAVHDAGAQSIAWDGLGGERHLLTIQIDFIEPERLRSTGGACNPVTGSQARRSVAGSTSAVRYRDRTF